MNTQRQHAATYIILFAAEEDEKSGKEKLRLFHCHRLTYFEYLMKELAN